MGKAIFVRETGGADVLRLEPHDPGPPGEGQVRIRVAACGVNFIDVYFRTGLYPQPPPFVPGLEGAGRVEEVGPGVEHVAPGDRVAWASVPGSYAEVVVGPADRVVRIPDGVADEQAAAVMLQGMTAHYLVHATRTPKAGDLALVHAAAGGVGLLLLQTLATAGVTAIGTCSTEAKGLLARAAGAADVILYSEQDFVEEIRKRTAGWGVDVVYDSVGASTFEGSLRCLRPRGLLVLFGQSSGPVPPFDLRRLSEHGSLFVTRPSLAHYIQDRPELELRAKAVLDAVMGGRLRVRIGARYPLGDAAEAHRALEERKTSAKLLLIP